MHNVRTITLATYSNRTGTTNTRLITEVATVTSSITGSHEVTEETVLITERLAVAFAVPILQKWAQDPSAIYAVVLTPTR